jgi:phosphate-selective porin OprO/OprP
MIGIGLLIGISVCRTPDAQAQDADTASVTELRERVQDLEATVRQLQEKHDPERAPTPLVSSPSGVPVAPVAPSPATLPVASGDPVVPAPGGSMAFPAISNSAGGKEGFYIQSPDKSCLLRITGQIQADFRGFLNDVDTSTTGNANVAGSPAGSTVTGSPDTFLIRRARLGIEATMLNYYEFRLLPDFAGSTISKSITDAYLNIHYWDEFQFEAGKFKQPFSFEQLIQDRFVPTMERSMMDQLVPQRDEGVMIHGHKLFDDRFDYAVAVSNGDVNDSTIDPNNHKDSNGRIAIRPFNDPEGWEIARGLQIGITGGVGVENEPLGNTASPPSITTPATVTWFAYNPGVWANGVRDRVSPELVYYYHSFGLAAQYFHEDQILQIPAKTPLVNVPTDGYYVLATYFLTGEQRTDYSEQIAPLHPFDPEAPIASPGAWELVFRVDQLEVGQQAFAAGLATSTAGSANRSSPEAFETTTGFNWYLNKWVRTQLNWEHAKFGGPVKIGNVPGAFSKEDALYTRFQIIF